MKFERWPQRAPKPWLLVRPGLAEQPWNWAQVEQGRVLAAGSGQPPAHAQARVALILPARSCSHFHVAAPPGLKRDEWPLLLEDRLLQAPEALTCGCATRQDGRLELVSIEQALLAEWLAQCERWQLPVERCWAEFQLLPVTPPGTALCWQREADFSYWKGSSEDARQHWLAWPAMLGGQPPALWRGLQVESLAGDWPPELAPLERLPSLFERHRPRALKLSLAPGQWRLPAACLVLAGIWCGLWMLQQYRQAAVYQAQVVAAIGPVASPRQAAQLLKRERQEADDHQLRLRQLEGLQAQLASWLNGSPGSRLRAVSFDGQRWTLRLQGDAATAPWQAMANEAGVAVAVADEDAGLKVVFDLGASS